MFDLTGKRALVTGASGSIGGGIARALHQQGAIVGLSGTRRDALETLAGELGERTFVLPCDLSEPEQVEKLIPDTEAAMGELDILVNNAGLNRDALAPRISDADWEKVIAVDLSPKMVEFGRALAEKHHLPNLEYRLGDLEEPPIEPGTADLAIFSQALHHAEHPQRALEAAFRILKPGGRVIILDLLQHTFEEARELYADRWLGFAEVDLSSMLERAGFGGIDIVVADREEEAPRFQTLLAVAEKAR